MSDKSLMVARGTRQTIADLNRAAARPCWQSDTCTMIDVIAQSILMHPSALIERLESSRKIHRAYIEERRAISRNGRDHAAEAAAGMVRAINQAIEYIRAGTAIAFADNLSACIITFAHACDLQLVPRHIRAVIAERG